MRFPVVLFVTLSGTYVAAHAGEPISYKASNITPYDTRSVIAPALPPPPVGDNASPQDYLRVAQQALARGRTGEAQEALERAEERALDRAVPLFRTDKPIEDPLVARIRQARLVLGSNDPARAMQIITSANDMAARLASSVIYISLQGARQ
jgi:hypothetical protein